MNKSLTLVLAVLLTGFFPGALHATHLDTFTLHNQVTRAAVQAEASARTSGPRMLKKLADSYRATLLNRFLRYVTYNSQSDYDQPITEGQIETAILLHKEISDMDLPIGTRIINKNHYVFVELPANVPGNIPTLGFSAHYDVSPDSHGTDVHPIVWEYQGGAIELPKPYQQTPTSQPQPQVLDPQDPTFSHLNDQIGKTVVTSDGSTLLGADDKSGVAILMTLLETLAKHPELKHGPIQIVLAPNEDVGRAAEFVDQTPYRPHIAFDFDGETNGEVMIENFNAFHYVVTVVGKGGHQAHARENGYCNVELPLSEFTRRVCSFNPADTLPLPDLRAERQGYAEPRKTTYPEQGNDYLAQKEFRLRSYSCEEVNNWVKHAEQVAQDITHTLYPNPNLKITGELTVDYKNVGEVAHPQAEFIVDQAFAAAGVPIHKVSIPAGTTAAMFVTKGLVGAYTIFTGQNNPHAPTEWLSEDDMFKSYTVALHIVNLVAQLEK